MDSKLDSKLDSKDAHPKTQTISNTVMRKQQTQPEASVQALGNVDGMLDVTQSHVFLNNNYESVSQSNATNKNINFQQMTTVLRSSKQSNHNFSQLEVSKAQSNPMMPSLTIQQNSKDLDPADMLYQQKFMRNCCKNHDGAPNSHHERCVNYAHIVKFDPESLKGKKRAPKSNIGGFQHRQFIPKVFGQNPKKLRKFSSALYSVTSKSREEEYYSLEKEISNLENGLLADSASREQQIINQEEETQESGKSQREQMIRRKSAGQHRNNSAANKRNRLPKRKKNRQKSSNLLRNQKATNDCAVIQEDLENDISNIQVSQQFGNEVQALGQYHSSDPLGQLQSHPDPNQYFTAQPNASIGDYNLGPQMREDLQSEGKTNNNSAIPNSLQNQKINYLSENAMAQLRASSKISAGRNDVVYVQPPWEQYDRGGSDSLERRMYHQQFGLLNDPNLLLNTHQGITGALDIPTAQSMAAEQMNAKSKLCNDTNTNSSQAMDEQKLGQQLQLMATQLTHVGTTELKEMQKHYQQLLEQKQKEQHQSMGQSALGSANESKEKILRYTDYNQDSLGSRIMGSALDQLAELKNAVHLINQQLLRKENGSESLEQGFQESKEGKAASPNSQEQEYYDFLELASHGLKPTSNESVTNQAMQIQSAATHNAVAGKPMTQKTPNNKQKTQGAGWKPTEISRASIHNSQSINKIEHGDMKNKYNELVLSSDRAQLNHKEVKGARQSPQSKNKISLQAGALTESNDKAGAAEKLSVVGHEIFGNAKGRVQPLSPQPLKVVVSSTAKIAADPQTGSRRQSQQSEQNTQKETATIQQPSTIKLDDHIKSGQFSQIDMLSSINKQRLAAIAQSKDSRQQLAGINPDLKNLAQSHQELMNFSVEKELLELLQKQMADERNEIYKYNLDKSYHYSHANEAKSRSPAAGGGSKLNFASINKKGDMEIRPVKTSRKTESYNLFGTNRQISKSKSKSTTNVTVQGASNILAVRQLNPSLKRLYGDRNQKSAGLPIPAPPNEERRSRQGQVSRGLVIAKVPKAHPQQQYDISPGGARSGMQESYHRNAMGRAFQHTGGQVGDTQTPHVEHLLLSQQMGSEAFAIPEAGQSSSNNVYTEYTEALPAKVKVVTNINRTASNYSNSQVTGESPTGTHLAHRMVQPAEGQIMQNLNIYQEDQGTSSVQESGINQSTLRRRQSYNQYSPESKKYKDGLISLVPLAREDSDVPSKHYIQETFGRRHDNEHSVGEADFLRESSAIKEHSERQQILSFNSQKQSTSSPARFIRLVKNSESISSQNEEEQEQQQLPLKIVPHDYDGDVDNEEEGDHDQATPHKHVARYSISEKNGSVGEDEAERPQIVTEKNSDNEQLLSGAMSSSKNHSNAKLKDNRSRSRGKSVLSASASNDPMIEASINIKKQIRSKGRASVHRSSQEERRAAFPSASIGSVSDVLINAKSTRSRQMVKAKTNVVLSNSKNSKTRSRQNSSKANDQERVPTGLHSPIDQSVYPLQNEMNVNENDVEIQDVDVVEQPLPSSRNRSLNRPASGDYQMQIGVFKPNLMLSDADMKEDDANENTKTQRRPMSSKISEQHITGNRGRSRYAKTPLDGIDEGQVLQTLNRIESNMAQRENQSKPTISDSCPIWQYAEPMAEDAADIPVASDHLQVVQSQEEDLLAQGLRTNTEGQNLERQAITDGKAANSQYLHTNQAANPTLSPPSNVRSSAPINGNSSRAQMQTMKNMSFIPLRQSASKGGHNSLLKIHSSHRGEEFSVAEMSAQAMLDLNDINTDASQQMNASYGAGTQLGLNTPQVLTRLMSNEKMQRANVQSAAHSPDESLQNIDLEVVIREAIRQQEEKQQQTISPVDKFNITQYVMQNKDVVLGQVNGPARNTYYAKQLVENPQMQTQKNFSAFRKQSDHDVYLRHIQNDKQFHLQKQDFELRGKKLHTIKQNMVEQAIFRYIWEQIEIAHQRALDAQKKGHNISVNVHAPNLIDGFQRYLLPSVSSRQQLPSASRIQSTRRTVRLNQRQQMANDDYASDARDGNQIYAQQQVLQSTIHQGAAVGSGRALGHTLEGSYSPYSRGGDTVTLADQRKGSGLTAGQHSNAVSNLPAFNNQPARHQASGRSYSSKGNGPRSPISTAMHRGAHVTYTQHTLTSGIAEVTRSKRSQEGEPSAITNNHEAHLQHNRFTSTGQSPAFYQHHSGQGAEQSGVKVLTSSVISHSGYGIGGGYSAPDNGGIKSPRMQHLNFVNDGDVNNILAGVDANARYAEAYAQQQQYLNLQAPQDEQNRRRTLLSNVQDSRVTASGLNVVESRDEDISYFQTDEINGSQSNRKTVKELAEYSKTSEAGRGAQLLLNQSNSNASPDLPNQYSMQTRTADLVQEAKAGDQALMRASDGSSCIRVEHHQPVRSVKVVSSERENGELPGNREHDEDNREMLYAPEMRITNAQAVGQQWNYTATELQIVQGFPGASHGQKDQAQEYYIHNHFYATGGLNSQAYMEYQQAQSMRDQGRANPMAAQVMQSSTIENPLQVQREQASGGTGESLKRTTLNESDQLVAHQFITKPVMTGSPLAAYGDPYPGDGNHVNLREAGAYTNARGRSNDRAALSTHARDDKKNKQAASPRSSRIGQQSGILTANHTLKTLPRNMSDDTNELHGQNAKNLPLDLDKKGGSQESFDDLGGLVQPRALRARIDLRESHARSGGLGADEAARSSFEDMRLLGLSKSKMLGDIGKSFQNMKFTNAAKSISNKFRMSKGMVLDSRMGKRQGASNIEYGGGAGSVRVSIVKATSETFDGRKDSHEDPPTRERSRYDSRLEHGQASRSGDRVLTEEGDQEYQQKRDQLLEQQVETIVRNYTKPAAGQPGPQQATAINSRLESTTTHAPKPEANGAQSMHPRAPSRADGRSSRAAAEVGAAAGQPLGPMQPHREPVAARGMLAQNAAATPSEQSMAVRHLHQPAAKTKKEGIFDERKSQATMRMNKTSRLNQRLMKGPGGLAQNMIGAVANHRGAQEEASRAQPSHHRVNYLVKNPTSHEMSRSRLIENSKVLKAGANCQGAPSSSNAQPQPQQRLQRLNSAIERGCLRSSYGYQDKRGPPGEFKTGGLVATTADGTKVLDEASCVGELLQAAGGKQGLFEQGQCKTRLQSAGWTHASTAIKDSLAGADAIYNRNDASLVGDLLMAENLQKQIDRDIREGTQVKGQEGADRARPKTAKVGGFANNLGASKNMQPNAESGFTITQKPARLESAHISGTAGHHQHRKNVEISKHQRSFHGTDSNIHIKKNGRSNLGSGQGNTIKLLSKVSGAQSNYTYMAKGLVLNNSQAFFPGKDSTRQSNQDLIEHGLPGMHMMNTMNMSERYREAASSSNRHDRYQLQQVVEEDQRPMSQQPNQMSSKQFAQMKSQKPQYLYGGVTKYMESTNADFLSSGASPTNESTAWGYRTQKQIGMQKKQQSLAIDLGSSKMGALTKTVTSLRPRTGIARNASLNYRKLQKGKVFKDANFEARQRNGRNGYIL